MNTSLFWASKYIRSGNEDSVFNRTYYQVGDEKILEMAPSLAADFFNDGEYDGEACTILSYLANVHDNGVQFRWVLEHIDEENVNDIFVWVTVQPDHIHIVCDSEYIEKLNNPDYPYKRMSIADLKRANLKPL